MSNSTVQKDGDEVDLSRPYSKPKTVRHDNTEADAVANDTGDAGTSAVSSNSTKHLKDVDGTAKDAATKNVNERYTLEPLVAPLNLWLQAYSALKVQDEDLVTKYEHVIAEETRVHVEAPAPKVGNDNNPTSDEVLELIKINIKKAENKSKTIEYLEKAAEVVTATKDFITSAASNEPHAALAWAGVSVLIPVCIALRLFHRCRKRGATTCARSALHSGLKILENEGYQI